MIYSPRMILGVVEAAQDWIEDGKAEEVVVQLFLDATGDVVDVHVVTKPENVEALKKKRDESMAAVHGELAQDA